MSSVLIVDDEKMIADPLARALTQAGYSMLVAANGRDSLSLALNHKPDLWCWTC